MTAEEFYELRDKLKVDTYNRTKGAFLRALWYGNKNRFIGQNKGMRKAIRNAPRTALKPAIDAIGLIPGGGMLVEAAVDIVLNKAKDAYGSSEIKQKLNEAKARVGKPPNQQAELAQLEAIRKKIKSEVKDITTNAMATIDRNMVKLNAAKSKVDPAFKKLASWEPIAKQSALSDKQAEMRMQDAEAALKAAFEFEYYVEKLRRLVAIVKHFAEDSEKRLEEMKIAAIDEVDKLEKYVVNNIVFEDL